MSETAPDPMLLRIFQLVSPTLPVGAYAYSQGLEWAVHAEWVHDEATLAQWLAEQLMHTLGALDLPVLARLYAAVEHHDDSAARRWSRTLLASRESRELVSDDNDRGRSLARLLRDLGIGEAQPWLTRTDIPFAALFAVAAVAWRIPLPHAALAYAWGWLENQVLAGVKLIPLGQVSGQRLLLQLAPRIPEVCRDGLSRGDAEIGSTLPMLAIASSLHETQYTRLFRS